MTPTSVSRVWHLVRTRSTARAKSDEGFTLVEVLVSLAVLLIIGAAAIPSLISLMTGSADAQYRVTATNLAQQDLSQERAIADRTQVVATTGQSRTVGGRTFTLSRTVTSPTGKACSGSYAVGFSPAYVDVTTTVTWTGATSPVVVATRLAC